MRRPAFYMCEDGDVDHYRSNRGAGRLLCFSFATEIVQFFCFLNLAISRGCTDWFVPLRYLF